ncbi:hypothetical protein MMC06_005439 [Schaereria dolodes]|nr:hypothetical protein [Schaereria dolodes]
MSFFYKASSNAFRAARIAPRAPFSISVRSQKSAVDTAKDTVKSVDRKISDAAVKGIEKGEQASATVKETVGVNASKASAKADGSTSEMAGEAKGKASELAGKAQGKTNELSGEVKGKAAEVKSKM